MITELKSRIRRFRSDEDGAIYTWEFAILLPILCLTLVYGVELTVHANRQFQLERGLEVTTRAIRLNTGQTFSHDEIKRTLCRNAGGLSDCEDNMRLELHPTNARAFTPLPATADCNSTTTEVTPVRGFNLGETHDLMLMRACYSYVPFMPNVGLGALIGNGANGKGTMTAVSAFVQEPTR